MKSDCLKEEDMAMASTSSVGNLGAACLEAEAGMDRLWEAYRSLSCTEVLTHQFKPVCQLTVMKNMFIQQIVVNITFAPGNCEHTENE